ncbi:hypothetical protein FQN49_006699 [Arthroderma sp. PD_2]|nr:hypothetical protein FQN49_006699 [Arthroderma sp. PD_2]
MAVEYSKKTNAELVEILKSRGLSHTGKKADMVARLQEADKSASAPAPIQPAPAAEDVIDWDDDAAEAPAATKEAPAVPDEKTAAEPVTTQAANVAKPEDKSEGAAVTATTEAGAAGVEATGDQATNGADKKAATEEKAAQKPAVDFTRGLATTDLDAELAKRKARAAKFGIADEPEVTESQKALERAKRFGTAGADEAARVKGLDEPLSTERPRKRGRGEDGESGRGKRRNLPGRGRGRGPRRGRNEGNRNGGNNNGGSVRDKMSEADRAAMERRRERFAAK